MMFGPKNDENFEERWKGFVAYMNLLRVNFPVEKDPFAAAVHKGFYDLLNQPDMVNRVKQLTPAHAVKALQMAGCTTYDAGFAMFVFFFYGAVWGNAGTLPTIVMMDGSPKTSVQN